MVVSSPPSTYAWPTVPRSWIARIPATASSTCRKLNPSWGNVRNFSLPVRIWSMKFPISDVSPGP